MSDAEFAQVWAALTEDLPIGQWADVLVRAKVDTSGTIWLLLVPVTADAPQT